jgi:hypothetical protein
VCSRLYVLSPVHLLQLPPLILQGGLLLLHLCAYLVLAGQHLLQQVIYTSAVTSISSRSTGTTSRGRGRSSRPLLFGRRPRDTRQVRLSMAQLHTTFRFRNKCCGSWIVARIPQLSAPQPQRTDEIQEDLREGKPPHRDVY